ncbi:MAG: hypothetical protein D6771_00630, partial [Zetaproteobacteria bacterium]
MSSRWQAWHEAGLRLALAAALAMLAGSGYLAAPVLFAKLDAKTAGDLAGAIFARAHPAAMLFLCAAAAFAWRRKVAAKAWWAWIAVAL